VAATDIRKAPSASSKAVGDAIATRTYAHTAVEFPNLGVDRPSVHGEMQQMPLDTLAHLQNATATGPCGLLRNGRDRPAFADPDVWSLWRALYLLLLKQQN
jgi:hypothetical protein